MTAISLLVSTLIFLLSLMRLPNLREVRTKLKFLRKKVILLWVIPKSASLKVVKFILIWSIQKMPLFLSET